MVSVKIRVTPPISSLYFCWLKVLNLSLPLLSPSLPFPPSPQYPLLSSILLLFLLSLNRLLSILLWFMSIFKYFCVLFFSKTKHPLKFHVLLWLLFLLLGSNISHQQSWCSLTVVFHWGNITNRHMNDIGCVPEFAFSSPPVFQRCRFSNMTQMGIPLLSWSAQGPPAKAQPLEIGPCESTGSWHCYLGQSCPCHRVCP